MAREQPMRPILVAALAVLITAGPSLAMAADSTAGGGPFADGSLSASAADNAPVNQGQAQSQQRVDQAEAAGRDQLDRAQRDAHDALQRNLERRRQENSQDADSLRQRANPSGFQPHH